MNRGNMGKISNLNKKRGILTMTTIVILLIVALSCVYTWYQIRNLENGILDVCATQQDAYVQLVLDQINLKENRDDEEIIMDILSTLDASSSKYWTFSKDRAMLFVKDIMETNRYKGLTTVSYYDSESAKEFLDSLMVDRVIHKTIIIEGKEYIASGVAFRYGENDYRLCLLTNRDVILSNNRFMGAKLEMIILVGFVLIVLLAATMLFARKQEMLLRTIDERDRTIDRLQDMIGQLNEMLCQKEHYDTRYQLWSKDAIKDFLEKIRMKNVRTVITAKIHCDTETDKHVFLEKASVILDKKVLRFVLSDNDFLLLYLLNDEKGFKASLTPILNQGIVLKELEPLVLGNTNLDHYVRDLDIEVQNGY